MTKRILHLASIVSLIIGLILLSRIFEPSIISWVTERIGRPPTEKTFFILRLASWSAISIAVIIQSYIQLVYPRLDHITQAINLVSKSFDNWLKKVFGNYIDFTTRPRQIDITAFNYQDTIIVTIIILFSLLWYLQRIQFDYPYVILGSDLANIASFSAALDHPELFKNDFLLSDTDNFRIYFQLHVLLTRVLGSWVNNYSAGILLILIPTVFLYLSGFYWLGRTITNNRYWAFVFTIFNLSPLYFAFETWGVVKDPTPRTGIQALLPFLLILVWKWKDKPDIIRWGLIAIFTGGLIYIHAAGTPIWMVCILVGLWTQMPKEWGYKKQVLVLAGLTTLILLTQFVFISNYLKYRVSGDIKNYKEMLELLRFLLPPEILNIPLTLKKTFRMLWSMWLIPFGIIGTILLYIIKQQDRNGLKLVVTWVLSVILVSAILPLIERTVESYLRIIPLETDLIRGLRYLVPLLSLLGLWGMSELSVRLKPAHGKWLLAIIGIFFAASIFNHRLEREFTFKATADCIQTGRILCLQRSDLHDILEVLHERTEPGAAVFFADHPADTTALAVRYLAQRPLVYSWKDRGAGLSDLDLMDRWFEIYSRLESEETTYKWFQDNPADLIQFVQGLGAKYLILNGQVTISEIDALPASVFYKNKTYIILELME